MRRISWPFICGFILGLLGFVLITGYIDKRARPICFDCHETFGFPFTFLETGGLEHTQRYIWSGILANLALALPFGLIVGILVKRVFPRKK
jgi:hypothetical protein